VTVGRDRGRSAQPVTTAGAAGISSLFRDLKRSAVTTMVAEPLAPDDTWPVLVYEMLTKSPLKRRLLPTIVIGSGGGGGGSGSVVFTPAPQVSQCIPQHRS